MEQLLPRKVWSLSDVCINTDKVNASAELIKAEFIKPVAMAFARNVHRIRTVLTMPKQFTSNLLSQAVLWYLIAKYGDNEAVKAAWLEFEPILNSCPENFDEATLKEFAARHRLIVRELLGPVALISRLKNLPDHLLSVLDSVPGVPEWVDGQLSSSTVLCWTAFECIAKDLWEEVTNSKPFEVVPLVLKAQSSGSGDGRDPVKTTSILKLLEHKLDLRRKMGTILSEKFDMTALRGLQEAYASVFVRKKTELASIFGVRDLKLLEATRHVIVHRGGIVDKSYFQKAKRLNSDATVGQPIVLSAKTVSDFANAVIDAACSLLLLVDKVVECNAF